MPHAAIVLMLPFVFRPAVQVLSLEIKAYRDTSDNRQVQHCEFGIPFCANEAKNNFSVPVFTMPFHTAVGVIRGPTAATSP